MCMTAEASDDDGCGDFLFDFLKMEGKKIKYECYLITKIKFGLRSALVVSCQRFSGFIIGTSLPVKYQEEQYLGVISIFEMSPTVEC